MPQQPEAGAHNRRNLRAPQPADLRLRHARPYQWTRRLMLALSAGSAVLVPAWHLKVLRAESAGMATGGPLAGLADLLHLPATAPPWVGSVGAANLFGLELVDPLSIVGVLAAGGGVSLAAALPVLLLVVLLGRFFCGWLCPYVPVLAASNALRSLLARLGRPPPDVALPRRLAFLGLGVLLVVTAVTGSQVALLAYPPAAISRAAFHAVFYGGAGVTTALVAAAFLLDTFVSRAGCCRSLCPGGALFQVLSVASPLKVVRTPAACTDCTACDVVCNLGQRPMSDRVDPGCERCGKCISVCPTDALELAWVRPSLPRRLP